jgi:Spy/CpxP family protein refolding chaperone
MNRIFLIVSCLLLFSVAGRAQQDAPQQSDFMKQRKSPMMQNSMKMGTKMAVRSFWDGNGANLMALGLVQQQPEVSAAFGISDEQVQQIQDVQKNLGMNLQQNPEFQEIMKEMQGIIKPDDPFMLNADEETQKKMQDIQGRVTSLTMNSMTDAIDNILTPEQKRKMDELQLASMSEMPIISPRMFDALDLTDEQKQKMEGIKKELQPEFENNLENLANGAITIQNKIFDEFEKQGGDMNADPKVLQEKMEAISKKLVEEDPELKKIQEEMASQGKLFATQFKMKMFDVLTDEQWARLQELTDNPPEYIKALRKKMQERFGGKAEQTGPWQPNADSWKPGEAIPEEYRQKRKTREFPKPESTEM